MNIEPYELKFYFEWQGGCLWPGNEKTYTELGFGPYDFEPLGRLILTPEILERCATLSNWYDTALNWDYPPDPGPWRQDECERFNAASQQLFDDLQVELGAKYRLINHQELMREDPDLDAYLRDPKNFRRKKS